MALLVRTSTSTGSMRTHPLLERQQSEKVSAPGWHEASSNSQLTSLHGDLERRLTRRAPSTVGLARAMAGQQRGPPPAWRGARPGGGMLPMAAQVHLQRSMGPPPTMMPMPPMAAPSPSPGLGPPPRAGPPPTSPWTALKTDDGKHTYYHNRATNETTWTRPRGSSTPPRQPRPPRSPSRTRVGSRWRSPAVRPTSTTQTRARSRGPPLPPSWPHAARRRQTRDRTGSATGSGTGSGTGSRSNAPNPSKNPSKNPMKNPPRPPSRTRTRTRMSTSTRMRTKHSTRLLPNPNPPSGWSASAITSSPRPRSRPSATTGRLRRGDGPRADSRARARP